jgi:hypothetical protein
LTIVWVVIFMRELDESEEFPSHVKDVQAFSSKDAAVDYSRRLRDLGGWIEISVTETVMDSKNAT